MNLVFLKIYFGLDIILIIISIFIKNDWLINTQVSFLSSFFIVYASMRGYKNMIDKELLSGKYDNLKDDENLKITIFKNVTSFFSPLKILGYFILGIGFYCLDKFQIFNAMAFLVGILPIPLGSIIYGVINGKS